MTLAAVLASSLSSPTFAAEDQAIYARPARLVRLPDGRRLNLVCTGQGAPTVILEAGWSDSSLAWRAVQPLIAKSHRVCAYDRSGLGFSDATSEPRDTLHIVEDLEGLLKAAKVPGPYVMVGYSMGGLSARLFTDRNRRAVQGMVLVEPSVEHQAERFRAVLPARLTRPVATDQTQDLSADVAAAYATQKAQPSYQHTILAELVGMQTAGSDEVAASRRGYGRLPLIVLTASENGGGQGYSPSEAATFKATWSQLHREVAALSILGEQRQVAGATHLIVFENPEAIARAVADVTERATYP